MPSFISKVSQINHLCANLNMGLVKNAVQKTVNIKRIFYAKTLLLAGTTLSNAQTEQITSTGLAPVIAMGLSASSMDILYFSMIIGAISATMISAVWLIRERSKIESENVDTTKNTKRPTKIDTRNGRLENLSFPLLFSRVKFFFLASQRSIR